MSLVTNTYAYLFVFRLTNKKTQRTEEHTVKTVAYSLNEGMVQAVYTLDADQNLDMKDYDIKILFAGPDIEELIKHVADTMQRGAR